MFSEIYSLFISMCQDKLNEQTECISKLKDVFHFCLFSFVFFHCLKLLKLLIPYILLS